MNANVAIVSTGARTPLGLNALASAAAVRAGLRRIQLHPTMVDSEGEAFRAGLDALLEPDRLGGGRLAVLAKSALDEALAPIAEKLAECGQVETLLSLPETRPGFTDTNAAWLARGITKSFPRSRPAEVVARGHAGALDALREALVRLTEGRAEVCVVLGVNSYFSPDTIAWLDSNRQIAGHRSRSGFIPGEAAGCLIVASGLAAGHLRRHPIARIRSAASAVETRRIKGNAEVLGHGLAEAILQANASSTFPGEAADDVYCDINGERYRTDEWGFTLFRAGHVVRNTAYRMSAHCWGDIGAATGALGCILASRAWARGYASGPRALVWGSSEAGLRSAVILEEAAESREVR